MNSLYDRNYPSLYRGIVESNEDSESLGRCRVRIPAIHGKLNYPVEALPWARPIVFSPVGSGRGSVNIPDVGDIVWVLFEGSSKEYPIYFGGTYAKDEISIDPHIVQFYIEGEDKISYDRNSRVYTIQVGGTQLSITPKDVILKWREEDYYE